MGGRFKREETYVYLWLIYIVWQKPAQHCKAIILQLINLRKKRRGSDILPLPCEDTAGRQPSTSKEEHICLTMETDTLISDFQASSTMTNRCLLFKPSSLWHFVIVA